MKLLDWMQHKFRQTNNEPSTEFAPRNSCSCLPGQPSFDDIQLYPKSHYYAKTSTKPQREGQFRKSFTCIETAKQTAAEEESAAVFSELFHGFLAIGTLAAETGTNEPKTPTFSTYNIEEESQETEPTEDELKLINDELEKVLEPEGRESGAVVCPLQDYLFGSVIELSETVAVPVTAKKEKEHRTSLGELFQKTKPVVEVINEGKNIKTEKIKEKESEKSAVCLMKKILKGRTHSSKHSTGDKKPSRKILQMFHRKVHPKGHPVEPKFENNIKHVTEGNMLSEDVIFPMVDITKKSANCTVGHMPSGCCVTDSDGNRECWIKSDADYLVLEL
ncbi:protein LAZY 1-like [Bidens hawaiensis]|uniref:protein LAZY 1-like n=1 Tax=Bidens hawaiensis TaxID=980011 RepID=UPI004049472E